MPPKRFINLRTCFNINRKADTRQRSIISLFTGEDCFSLQLDYEAELQTWLTLMLELQQGREYLDPDAVPKPNYEHVWEVKVLERSLGRTLEGLHRLCLTANYLTLVRLGAENSPAVEFELTTIEQCGYSNNLFHFTTGRQTTTGPGEIWMVVEDNLIAQSIHDTVLNTMRLSAPDRQFPWLRARSYSNESSKPICVAPGRGASAAASSSAASSSRGRADGVPGRQRTSPGGPVGDADTSANSASSSSSMNALYCPMEQPRSMSVHSGSMSCSPPYSLSPVGSLARPFAPNSDCSFSFDENDVPSDISYGKYGHSLTEDIPFQPPIVEEMEPLGSDSYMTMAPGDYESQRNENKVDYMDMNPSAQLDLSTTPQSSSVTSPIDASWHSMNSPPSFLAVGAMSSGVKALHPTPQSAPTSSSADDYLEMASPAGNSTTADTPDGYMPMSPVGSLYSSSSQSGRPRTTSASASTHMSPEPFPTIKSPILTPDGGKEATTVPESDHSGSSSSGYVPMAPVKDSLVAGVKRQSPQEDEGYMDMTPVSQTIATTTSGELKPEPSLSRRSSGTPSTDLCFTEYPLDKVRSYFTPSEDDEPIMVRAYSIGSRAETNATSARNSKLDAVGAVAEASRTRAFSVGSKRANNGKVGSKLASGVAQPVSTSSAVATSKSAFDERNKKSSSAPLLGSSPFGNTWAPGGNFAHHKMYTSGSGNRSNPRNEDLMEMDFPGSSNGNYAVTGSSNRPRTNSRSSHGRPAKMDTQLQSIGEKTNCVATLTAAASSTSSETMNGGSRLAATAPSTARMSDYADMSAMSASTKAVAAVFGKPRSGESDAVDRKSHVRGGGYKRNSVGSHDSKPVSRLSAQLNSTDYVDMNMTRKEATETATRKNSTTLSPVVRRGSTSPVNAGGSDDYARMSRPGSSPGSGEYVNIDPSVRQLSRSPAPFDMLPLTSAGTTASTLSFSASQPRKAWTLSGSAQSPKLEDAPIVTSSTKSSTTTRRPVSSSFDGPAVTSSPTTPVTSSTLIADAAARHNPEYANLQFARRGEQDNRRPSPAAISNPIPVGGGAAAGGGGMRPTLAPLAAPANRPPSDSDYAFMSPQVVHAAGVESVVANRNAPAYTVTAVRPGGGEAWKVSGSTATVAPSTVTSCSVAVAVKIAEVAPALISDPVSAPPAESVLVTDPVHLTLPASSSSSSDLSAAAGSDVSDSAVFVESEPVSPAKRGSADGGVRVQSSPSRPASVSSERELNYASLDLAPVISVPEETRASGDGAEGDSAVGGPLAYAQIDFSKSEGLRAATSSVTIDRQNRV